MQKENEKDLAELPDNVKRALKIGPVAVVEEVLEHAMTKPLTAEDWGEEADLEASSLASGGGGGGGNGDDDGTGIVTH